MHMHIAKRGVILRIRECKPIIYAIPIQNRLRHGHDGLPYTRSQARREGGRQEKIPGPPALMGAPSSVPY